MRRFVEMMLSVLTSLNGTFMSVCLALAFNDSEYEQKVTKGPIDSNAGSLGSNACC